jgi:uncharacterized protein YbjT (DUF2867 family)
MARKETLRMSQPVLVAGAAGGTQGSTGRLVANFLMESGVPVRALVHTLDARSDDLQKRGAEVVEGDLLNPASVQAAMKNIKRAYFTYPVADGLVDATAIFASAAREAGLEMVVNNSQLQGAPGSPDFSNLQQAPTYRNLQHRLADRVFDWSEAGAVHIQAPPYYENVRALVSRSVSEQNAVFLPWGDGGAVIPLVGAEDVARVAATLLANPGLPSQRAYALVSETPTVREIVETLGSAIGRPIRYIPITDEQWADAVKERMNAHALDHLTRLWRYFRNGGAGVQVTDSISAVTGRSPQTLEEFFRARCHVN